MAFTEIRDQIERILTSPVEQLGRGARLLRTQVELWRHCARRLRTHNLGAMSAALSFRTIFALIPTLVLAFLALKSMGFVEDGRRALRDFLHTSGFEQLVAIDAETRPDGDDDLAVESGSDDRTRISAADQIEALVTDVETKLTFERIGPIGALLLIWTAMTLLTTLESSLNRIFEAPQSRAIARRVILFWSSITLGPILIVAAIYVGEVAITSASSLPLAGWLAQSLGWVLPILVGVLVVAAGYRLIPNTHVRSDAALGGAIIAVPAWLVARWAFAIYVERFVLQGNLYGVLGLLPLFLLWLNVSWSIFLFGAELAHTATNLDRLRKAESSDKLAMGPSDWIAVALAVGEPYAHGAGPATFEQTVLATRLPGNVVRTILDAMAQAGLILATDEREPRFVPARPLEQIPVANVLQLADPRAGQTADEDDGLQVAVAGAAERMRSCWNGASLRTLLDESHQGSRPISHSASSAS